MTVDEVFEHLRSLGFSPSSDIGQSFERKQGPIVLRASLSWPDGRVALNGSYCDARQMADTEGMLDRSVFDMMMCPVGLLPENPSPADIADRIDEILGELPELPILTRLRREIMWGNTEEVTDLLASHRFPTTIKLGRARGSMLHFARTADMVRLLTSFGVDPNQPTRSGRTPILETTDDRVIEALLRARASVSCRDGDGQTALHRPLTLRTLRPLVAAGADVCARDQNGCVPLHHCIELPALVFMLAQGAAVNAQDNAGRTALSINLLADRLPQVGVLLAHGADPEQPGTEGRTAIFFARSAAALQLLLHDFEANVHARSMRGCTALHDCPDAECVDLLCGRGLAVNLEDADGQTPLHLSRTVGVTRALLARGAALEARDRFDQTPLHHAVKRADHHVVHELLVRGANPSVIDKEGKTPLDVARTTHIAERLTAAGANSKSVPHGC